MFIILETGFEVALDGDDMRGKESPLSVLN